jgi:hypothetical protein
MRAIFLSYRRDDSEGEAGHLFSDLVGVFGENAVFMDVAAIAAGRDFRKAIDESVATCGVLLAIIGKEWTEVKNEAGQRRLDDALDFVRIETASALKRDIPVIPVLVHGARMPRTDQLPDDLKELAYRNGVELTHARWNSDLHLLIKALRPHIEDPKNLAGSLSKTVPGLTTESKAPLRVETNVLEVTAETSAPTRKKPLGRILPLAVAVLGAVTVVAYMMNIVPPIPPPNPNDRGQKPVLSMESPAPVSSEGDTRLSAQVERGVRGLQQDAESPQVADAVVEAQKPSKILIGAGIRLLQEPQEKAKRVEILPFGTIVNEIERLPSPDIVDGVKDYYYKVKVSSPTGNEGWIHGRFLRTIDIRNSYSTYIEVVKDKMNSKDFGDMVEVTKFLKGIINETNDTTIKEHIRQLLLKALRRSLEMIPPDQSHVPRYSEWIRENEREPYWQAVARSLRRGN